MSFPPLKICLIKRHQTWASRAQVDIIFYWMGTALYGGKLAAKTCEYSKVILKDKFNKNSISFCAAKCNF